MVEAGSASTPPNVLAIGVCPEHAGALRLLGIPYVSVTPADFARVRLYDYQVLFQGWTFEGCDGGLAALSARRADIQNF